MGDDFSELMALEADIEHAADALPKYLRKALDVTSIKVKKDAQQTVNGRKGLGHAAGAIDYDLNGSSGVVSEMSSEIGYNKGKPAGALGNLIEFGSPNSGNQLAPSHDLGNAMLANEADFQKGVEAAAADAMREAGL